MTYQAVCGESTGTAIRRWVTGDTHFGHTNLQKHTRRPTDVDELIVTAWRRLIRPEDLVIHLGDVAFGHVDLPELLSTLPGRKVLVRGNHDAHTVSWYMNSGFDFASDAILLGGIFFTHEPAPVLPAGCEFNIHGHLHNNVPEAFRCSPHNRLFALEYTNYEPRQVEKFLKQSSRLTAV